MVDYNEDSEMRGYGSEEDWGAEDDWGVEGQEGQYSALIDDELQTSVKKAEFSMIHGDEIQKKLEECLVEANDLFAMENDSLIIVLRHFSWNLEKMQAAWFD